MTHFLAESVDAPRDEIASDLEKFPTGGVEKDGHADHEPDFAGAKHEDTGRGQQIDAARLGEEFAHRLRGFRFAELSRQRDETGGEDGADEDGHQPECVLKAY